MVLRLLEISPEEADVYPRRLLLATVGLWLAGLLALMVRVRVARPA